ncbi:MAG: DUF4351 domain-containing protein [Gammaproteobacteria bacterium]|nr:DUF4351 domain-containing protein [Gammaproteobacteria bacterium]
MGVIAYDGPAGELDTHGRRITHWYGCPFGWWSQRARDEGMQQGRIDGERAVLERLLRRRFGLLAPAVADRLNQASTAELENWADNVLDAETLDDVFHRPEPR